MTRSAMGYLKRQYLCVLRRNALLMAGIGFMGGSAALAQPPSIVTDGRTATQLTTQGAVTDIRTQTVRGATAFNSFSKFNVETARTVNLHLPGQTANLLNLVTGEASYINGLVNSYKAGQIGGNVFFLNPHGVVVGSTGVLNVGSLTLVTPTTGFMDRLMSASGAIDDAATAAVLAGQIPLSATGLVSVKGRINAAEAVTLAGGNVDIGAGAQVFAGGHAQVAFADLVNVNGLAVPSMVSFDGGVIRIRAAQDIQVAGTVAADGVGGNAKGGSVTVMADGNSALAASGRVSADAAGSGDGGFVEFSAKGDVNLMGNGLSARAAQGKAGSILIDPDNLDWTSANDFYSHGAAVTISATKKVVLDGVFVSSRNVGAVADTRSNHDTLASTGNSGNISVTAKQIEIKNGSQLRADANNGKTAGDVSITATDDAVTPVFGSSEDQKASISINNAVIRGRDVTIKAAADDKFHFVGAQDNSTVGGFFANIGIAALDFITSLRLGANVTFSKAQATVDIDGGADIGASGKLKVEAEAKADASMKVVSSLVGFGYGETNALAKVKVGNAKLSSTGEMSIKAQADSTLGVEVDTVNTGSLANPVSAASKYANFSFAVGLGTQVAEATVESAATITSADKFTLEATGEKKHTVAASGGSFKDGVASAGISVGISNTNFTASLGGNTTAKSVEVRAVMKGAETEVSAAAGTGGSPDLKEAITSAKPVDEILFEKLSDLMAAAPSTDSKSGSSSKLGLSAAFAWAENTNNVKAQIVGGAHVTTTGAVSVKAQANEAISFATSAAVDQRDLDKETPGDTKKPADKKAIAISASIAIVQMQHHADALIDDGAVVNAGGAVTVYAESSIDPFWSAWTTAIDKFNAMNWNSASAWYDFAGAVKEVVADPIHGTVWSQTAVESDKLALAGALDFFTLNNKATAKIGNATINAGSGAATALQDVSVIATASQGTLNLTGIPEFDPTSFGTNSTSGKAGFGGSYLQFNLSGGTDASIAKGAKVRADDVVVAAHTDFLNIDVAETNGKAGKVSINGAFSLLNVDTHTIAQIGSGGTMLANDVLVLAKDTSLFINVAGGVARSEAVGIGFSIAINNVDREVRAIIGNRSTETGSGGTLTASGNLLLDTQVSNVIGAFSVAGAGPAAKEDDATAKGGDGAKTNSKDGGKQGKSGVGISAAVAVNIVNDTSSATISDLATVTVNGTAAVSVAVQTDFDGSAKDDVALAAGLKVNAENRALALGGAGALTVDPNKSAGLAGAFTWNELVKDTRATVEDATVGVASGLLVNAKNTGAMWSVTAAAAGGDKVGIAGSVSYSNIDNITEAALSNANVTTTLAATLTAKDDSDIRSVAGAASYGGKAGIGAGVAISTVDSDTLAHIDGGSVASGGKVSATATNDNSIVSVAAALGASQGVTVSGSVTVNIITNRTEAAQTGASITSGGSSVELSGNDTSNILSIAGSVALSGGQAAVGIAAAYNEINNETSALASGGSMGGINVYLDAAETAEIRTYAVGGSGSAKVAVTGSLGINTIGNTTMASGTGTTITASGDARIRATDTSEIQSLTGAAAVGGNGAVGASGSYNHIGGAVKALVSGGKITAANATIDAERTGTMDVWAISGSGAGTAGISGSVAVNDAGGTTQAKVSGAAEIAATGNALVLAQADDAIKSRAGAVGLGGTLGAAGAIAFNDIHSSTQAEVSGANTKVTASGNGSAASVDNGVLSARDAAKLPSQQLLGTRQQHDSMRGVAVVASSTSSVENFAISAAGGGNAAIAATVSVAMLGGDTSSIVSNGAAVNTSFGGVNQEARIAAYHHDNNWSVTGGVAVGGDAGIGGAVDTTVASHTTTAKVDGATVQAKKTVGVKAGSTNEVGQKVIAVGGGVYVGLAGTGGVVLINGQTDALANNATVNSQGNIDLLANSRTDVDLIAGALAVSGVAGVGLTAGVTLVEQKANAKASGTSKFNANGTTTIEADSSFNQSVYAYTAAAAGGVGIAGTVNVVVVKGSTLAEVGSQTEINQDTVNYGGSGQNVAVSASDTTKVDNKVGSLGVGLGGAGIGAVADVVLIHNGATANIAGGAKVAADNDISVTANTVRDVTSVSTAFGGGSTLGIAGAVSVVSVGARPEGDAKDNTSGSINKAGQLSSASATGDQMGSDGGTSASSTRADNARANINLNGDLNTTPVNTTAGAYVGVGAILNAGRDINVKAHNKTDTDAIAAGAAVSGGVSLGGGIAIALVKDVTVASLKGQTTATRNVTVTATDDQPDVSIMRTYAGGGGVAGLAASFAWHEKKSTALAELGGTVTSTTGGVVVDAGVDHNLEVNGGGVGIGVVGIGASIGIITEDGEATANVSTGTHVTAKSLDVHGHIRTTSEGNVLAAAGGLISGAGADMQVKDSSGASANLGQGVVLRTAGGLAQVRADSDPVAKAAAKGVAISAGLSIGISNTEAIANTTTKATAGDNLDVQSDGLSFSATTKLRNGSRTAYADSLAAAGGALVGASATVAKAEVNPVTQVQLGSGNQVTLTGAFNALANSTTKSKSNVLGINVGFYAAGANVADTTANSTTETTIAGGTFITGAFNAKSTSSDGLDAASRSGAGGLGVLLAAKVDNDADAHTLTRVGGVVNATTMTLEAKHTTDVQGTADSTSASVAGYSGAWVTNTVDNVTRAELANNADVAAQSFVMNAEVNVTKGSANYGWTVQAASGGILSGASGASKTTIHNDTDAVIGSNAVVDTFRLGAPMGNIQMDAKNNVQVYDAVLLDTGGAIAIAHTESYIKADRLNATVTVGSGSVLSSDGDIVLEAKTLATVDTEAQSKTYGLAGAPSGKSLSRITTANNVNIDGARLETDENARIFAGYHNNLRADAETRLWNKTVIPINSTPEAHGEINQSNNITVGNYNANLAGVTDPTQQLIKGAAIGTVKDIELRAGAGNHVTRGYGRGTDLYREALEALGKVFDSSISLDITGGSEKDDSRSGVAVNGGLFAGTHYQQFLTIAADGTVTRQSEGMATPVQHTNVDLARDISDRIARLTALYNEYKDDNADIANGFLADIDILNAKKSKLGVGATATFLDIQPAAAYTGYIHINGDKLVGSGKITAPGDAKIEIANASNKFLRVVGNGGLPSLFISEDLGGVVDFNNVRVSSVGEINAINKGGATASFTQVVDRGNSPDPVILLKNTYKDNINLDALNPEIHVDGDITNMRGLVKIESAGSVQVSSNIVAKTVDIATGGDFIKTFTVGFTHQGGDPTLNVLNGSVAGHASVSRPVKDPLTGITTNRLVPYTVDLYYEDVARGAYPNHVPDDANGVPSGASTTHATWTANAFQPAVQGSVIAGNNVFISGEKLNINGLIQSGLASYTVNISAADANAAKAANGNFVALAMTENGESVKDVFRPQLRWDAAKSQLELGSIAVAGGYIQLYGDIFSTGSGKIKVLDGYGRINVTNTSGLDLAVNKLDTGPGVAGQIKITDTSTKVNAGGVLKPLVTVISLVNDVVTYNYQNFNSGDDRTPFGVANGSTRTGTYNPRDGRRLYWADAETWTNEYWETYHKSCYGGCNFLGDLLSADPGSRQAFLSTKALSVRPGGEWLADAPYTKGVAQPAYKMEYTKAISPVIYTAGLDASATNGGHYWTDHCFAGICVDDYENFISKRDWTWTEKSYYKHSLDASRPIAIEFSGFKTGALAVDNASKNLLLQGAVRNLTGATDISVGSIKSNDGVVVYAKDLNLNAKAGDIGRPAARPADSSYLTVELASGGKLDARATGGMAIEQQFGALDVKRAQAGGLVDLKADGNIDSSNAAVVSGSSIRLTSANGAIGSIATPLQIDVTSPTGTIEAYAAKDIALTETSGDMRLLSVTSVAGDLRLESKTGALIDANDAQRVDLETKAELLQSAKRARLMVADGADDGVAATVASFNIAKKQDYFQYWQMRGIKETFDANGNSTGFTALAYDPAFKFVVDPGTAATLKTVNSWGDAELQAYQDTRTKFYHAAATDFGKGAAGTFNKNFSYDVATADATRFAAMKQGGAWTSDEITNRIGAGFFKDVSDTEILIEAPNAVGRNITLIAKTGIGIEKTPLDINTSPSSWSEADQLALIAAEKSDISISTSIGGRRITIKQKDDVDFTLQNGGVITASAANSIYLGSEDDVRINLISTPEDVRLKTGTALTSSGAVGQTVVNARNITLEAGGGDLGTDAKDLVVQHALLGAVTARAGGNLYLTNGSGDLRVDQVFSPALARITAKGALIEATPDLNLDVQAKFMQLIAGTTIGLGASPTNYLDIGSDATGWIDLTAPNGIYIYTPNAILNLRNVQASNGEFKLDGTADKVNLTGDIAIAKDMALKMSDTLSLGAGVNLITTAGDIRLDAKSIDMQAGSRMNAILGSVVAIATNNIQLGDVNAGKNIQWQAGSGVLASGKLAAGGDLTGTSGGNTTLAGMSTVAGKATLNAGAKLQIGGTTTVGGDLLGTSVGDLETAGTTQVAGKLTGTAGGNLAVGGAATVGGDTALNATGNVSLAGTATLGGKLQASSGLNIESSGQVDVTKTIDLVAGSAISTISGAISGKETAALQAGSDINVAGNVQAAGKLDANAARSVKFDGGRLSSGADIVVNGGTSGAGDVLGTAKVGADIKAAGFVTVKAPGTIGGVNPLEIEMGGKLTLQAKDVSAAAKPAVPGAPVVVDVTGTGGAMASTVKLDVKGASTTTLKNYSANTGAVQTDSGNLIVQQGTVGDFVLFNTPFFSSRIDHVNRGPIEGVDIRAFTLSGKFTLDYKPGSAFVDAAVIKSNEKLIVTGSPKGSVTQVVAGGLRFAPSPESASAFVPQTADDKLVTVKPGLMDELINQDNQK